MALNPCFEPLMTQAVRRVMYDSYFLDPFFMFMQNNATYEWVRQTGRSLDCYIKYLNVNIPTPSLEDCCDPDECFGRLKEVQFEKMYCEAFVRKAYRYATPIGISCVPAQADNLGLMTASQLQEKFVNQLATIIPRVVMQSLYDDVNMCDDVSGSKFVNPLEFAENKIYAMGASSVIDKGMLMRMSQKFNGISGDIANGNYVMFVPSSYYADYINSAVANNNCCNFTITMPDGTTRISNRTAVWTQDGLTGVTLIPLKDEYFKVNNTTDNKPIMPFMAVNGLHVMIDANLQNVGHDFGNDMASVQDVNFGNMSIGYAGVDKDINYHLASKVYMWAYVSAGYLYPEAMSWVIGDKPITPNAGAVNWTLPASPQPADEPMQFQGIPDVTVNIPKNGGRK